MSTYVKGSAVANATKYDLLEKIGENNYKTLVEDASEINFDLSKLTFEEGDHVLVVVAQADGYADSDKSNEVIYSVGEGGSSGSGSSGGSGSTDTGETGVIYENSALTLSAYGNVVVTSEFAKCIAGETYTMTVTGGKLRILCDVDSSVYGESKYYPAGNLGVSEDGANSTNKSPYQFEWTEEAASATKVRIESRDAEETTFTVSITGPVSS